MVTFYKILLFLMLIITSTFSFKLSGGRPMGDSLVRYFDKEMPDLLIHKRYSSPTECDTVERIIKVTLDDKITDIFIYSEEGRVVSREGKTPQLNIESKDIVLTEMLSFEYEGDSIKSTRLDVRANGKMVPNTLEEFIYTDSLMMITTKISMIPGYPLEYAFRDIYYLKDSTMNNRHNSFSFIDLGNGHSYWHERFREVEFYNNIDSVYDKSICFSLSRVDTTWKTTNYSLSNDTSITTTVQQLDSFPQVIMERVTKTYNNDGKVTSIVSEKRKSRECPLKYYSKEIFKYFESDSMIYERSFYDTLSGLFELSTKEIHLLNPLDGKYRLILYFENREDELVLVGEDVFIYSNNTDIQFFNKMNLSTINLKKSIIPEAIILTINRSDEELHGSLFNMHGREIKSYTSETIENSEVFKINHNSLASGKYIFIFFNQGKRYSLPLLINK